jgi:hypothetical protein
MDIQTLPCFAKGRRIAVASGVDRWSGVLQIESPAVA